MVGPPPGRRSGEGRGADRLATPAKDRAAGLEREGSIDLSLASRVSDASTLPCRTPVAEPAQEDRPDLLTKINI